MVEQFAESEEVFGAREYINSGEGGVKKPLID